MKKRLISILLSLCMVLTLLPATVLSAGVGTSKAGDAAFTLSASSASCADRHTGELGSIQVTNVDISKWKSDKRITIQYDVQYRCTDSSCELYDSDDSFFSYSGEHTFTDTNGEFCHKKISESFATTIPAALPSGATKNFSVSFTLTSDKGIYESVLHEQNVNLCTENYYSVSCWECTGCGYFFQDADMSGNKFTKDKVYFPPVGHNLKHVPAKDPTCVAKGTVEHWHCERCTRNFGDEQGTSELTTIETNAPLAAHRYDADGVCEVCNRKAAAGVQANAGMVWYDTMGKALTALTYGAQLSINADYADTITLNQACTVEVKAGVTAADIQIENVENCVVTIVNNGIISHLSGYTGKVVLMSAEGTYGSIINQTSGGNVGSFLYGDPEDANKFCYYKNLTNGKWILPAEATTNTQSNVKVSYAPMAYIEIAGDGVTGSDGSYALTTSSGNTVAFTATAKTADGNDRANVTYKWYYDGQDDTILSEKAELTIENIKAGKRTVVCMATADDYSISAKIVLTVAGEKEPQNFTLNVSKTTVGIREKILPLLSVEGIKEDAAITYYLMNGSSPAPESDTVIDENFAFAQTGTGSIYAYTAETDNYAATASAPVSINVTPHANHCICGGMFNHTHENVEWQAWDGKSEIKYEQKWVQVSEYTKQGRYVAYVYLTGNVSANLTVAPKHILYLCLNGYSFTCADPSQPAITLTGEDGKPVELDLCDCVGTGTLGGSNASGGSIRIGAYANATLYSGTLTGNNVSGDGGAVSVTGGNCSFTMYGGAITGNTATGNGGGISSYDSWNAGTVNINGGVISNNRATNGGGIYAASRTHFHLNGGEIINNTATGDGGGVYCSGLYSNADGRCEFNGSTISGNTAQRGGGAYVRVCFIGYRNCRITGNTATEAGGGLYLEPFASAKIIYMGNVYGGGGTIAPYIYDNTVNSAQNNLYLSDPDTQIVFTARINTDADAKLGVYFTGITQNGASVLLNSLQINSESRAKPYLDRIFCDNPEYGQLEIQQDGEYYNLYLRSTISAVKVTLDPNGGTLNAGEESKLVQPDSLYGSLPTPTRADYRFDGWFTEKDGGTKVEETTIMSSRAAHTLYAHWTFLHEHCICGGDVTAGDHTSHSDVTYQKWDGKSSSISYTNNVAHVYLTENAQISDNIFVPAGKTLCLCLNGKEYAKPSDVSTQRKFIVTGGGHLILCDCVGTGSINCGKSDGGGGCVYLNSSTMDMYGGKFTGSSAALGGAIAVVNSTLNLYGGEISGNTASEKGGAVYVESGTVNISGKPVVKDNTVSSQPNNIYLPTGKAVSITGSMADGAEVGITTESTAYPVVFSNAWKTDYSEYFFADSANAHVEYNDDKQLQLAAGAPVMHTHDWATGWSSNSTHHWHECTAEGCTITDNSQKDGYAEHSGTDDNNCTTAVTCECGYEIKAAKAEHNWSVWSHNTTTHTHSCQNEGCGTTETKDCTGGTATCTAQAVCEVCGGAYGELAAHSFTEETAAEQYLKSAATCTKKAVYYKSCSVCGLSSEGTAEEATFFAGNILDHDWGAWTSNGDGTHTHVCSRNAAHTETGNCTGGTATCTAKAVCETCGSEYGEMKAHNFTAETAEEKYLKSAATCIAKAVYYKSCTVCGEKGTETFEYGNPLGHDYGAWTSNDNGTHTRVCSRDAIHTETENCSGGEATCTEQATCEFCGKKYGEPLGHTYKPEWITNEQRHWHVCARCDHIKDMGVHRFGEWSIVRRPTSTKTGERVRSCTICNYEETEELPVTGGYVLPYYKLTFETNGGSSLEPVVKIKGTVIDLAEYSAYRYGYTFDGWYADEALTQRVTSVTLDADKTVYAAWTRNRFFEDVTIADWFYDDVMFVCGRGVMQGVSDTRFGPHLTATRAMMATILWRMEGSPAPTAEARFTDVRSGQWYSEAVAWTAQSGVYTGYADGSFRPNDSITREQLAAILYRYAKYKGVDVSVGEDTNILSYADAAEISDYAFPAMQWACGAGVMQGSNGNLLPRGRATRAQIAAMLHRYLVK